MRSFALGIVFMGVLAGCGSGAAGAPTAIDGLDCDSDLREGYHLDFAKASPRFDSPEEAVRDVVNVSGGDLVVGEERDRGDVVAVDVLVERGGQAYMRVEVWKTGDGWAADNVRACG